MVTNLGVTTLDTSNPAMPNMSAGMNTALANSGYNYSNPSANAGGIDPNLKLGGGDTFGMDYYNNLTKQWQNTTTQQLTDPAFIAANDKQASAEAGSGTLLGSNLNKDIATKVGSIEGNNLYGLQNAILQTRLGANDRVTAALQNILTLDAGAVSSAQTAYDEVFKTDPTSPKLTGLKAALDAAITKQSTDTQDVNSRLGGGGTGTPATPPTQPATPTGSTTVTPTPTAPSAPTAGTPPATTTPATPAGTTTPTPVNDAGQVQLPTGTGIADATQFKSANEGDVVSFNDGSGIKYAQKSADGTPKLVTKDVFTLYKAGTSTEAGAVQQGDSFKYNGQYYTKTGDGMAEKSTRMDYWKPKIDVADSAIKSNTEAINTHLQDLQNSGRDLNRTKVFEAAVNYFHSNAYKVEQILAGGQGAATDADAQKFFDVVSFLNQYASSRSTDNIDARNLPADWIDMASSLGVTIDTSKPTMGVHAGL